MDHSNPEGNKHVHQQCSHGMCLNHGPEWKNVGEKKFKPNPYIFGKKTYWTSRCCGKAMSRVNQVQARLCQKCGRTDENIVSYETALCLCCGRHFYNGPSHYD